MKKKEVIKIFEKAENRNRKLERERKEYISFLNKCINELNEACYKLDNSSLNSIERSFKNEGKTAMKEFISNFAKREELYLEATEKNEMGEDRNFRLQYF